MNKPKPKERQIKLFSFLKKKDTPKKEETTSFQPLKPPARWLFLNYITADNVVSTTKRRLKELDELEKVGSDENVHIVAYIDIGPDPNPLDGTWSGGRAYYITKDDVVGQIGSEVIEIHEKVDMSDPRVLRDFIVEGIMSFPADNVVLILNDKSGVGYGGALDDISDGQHMSLPDIAKAILAAQEFTNKKIDVIGFDIPNMAELEVVYELRDTAKLFISSESYGGGMLSGEIIGEVIAKIQQTLKNKYPLEISNFVELFTRIVEDRFKEDEEVLDTLSVINLKNLDVLVKAVETLAGAVKGSSPTSKAKVRRAFEEAESYGVAYPRDALRDLYDVADKITAYNADKNILRASRMVMNAVKEVVIINKVNPSTNPKSYGVSIYAPLLSNKSDLCLNYIELAFHRDTSWTDAIASLVL